MDRISGLQGLNPLTLNFKAPWKSLEPDFQRDNIADSLSRIRSALILVTFLYGIFGILDFWMVPDAKELSWLIRYIIIVPAGVLTIYLTYRDLFLKYSQPILFALSFIGGIGIIIMLTVSRSAYSHTYYAGLILIFITVHTYLQMRFFWATLNTVSLVIIYEVGSLLFTDISLMVFLNINFFFLSSAVICITAGYINEVNVRGLYLSEYLLKREKEKVISQKKKMEMLGTISSGIAHDFNNMLTSLQGYTELSLNETERDSPVYSYQQEVFRVARRAQVMTQEILSFTREESTSAEPVDLGAVFSEIEAYTGPLLVPSVSLNLDLQTHRKIKADKHQIYRILANLITNSLHVLEDAGGDLRLSAHEEPRGYVTISVTDTGPGIKDEDRDRIFEPYFSTKKKGGGTGLGLYIVKQLVERYDGKIHIESNAGSGTEFRLIFPATEEK